MDIWILKEIVFHKKSRWENCLAEKYPRKGRMPSKENLYLALL